MNRYEEKQEVRRARLEAAADRAEGRAEAAYNRADLSEEASGIPLGQPILVGHHSERRHRRAIERAHKAMDNCMAEGKRAADLRAKAASVGSGGISSDDPEALQKLKEKLSRLEGKQAFMKEGNKLVRRVIKNGAPENEEALQDLAAQLNALEPAWGVAATRELLKPQWGNAGPVGFPPYRLQNNGAEIRRLKKRITQLEKASDLDTRRHVFQGFCEVIENSEENRLQFIFEGKPAAETRALLKGHGFKWAPSQGAWQRKLTGNARYSAKLLLKELGL